LSSSGLNCGAAGYIPPRILASVAVKISENLEMYFDAFQWSFLTSEGWFSGCIRKFSTEWVC